MTHLKTLFAGLLASMPAAYAADLSEIDSQLAERWADGLFQEAFKEKRFSGAVVAMVKDGAILFSKGYGYADYETRQPMDPASTLVRVCSLSKTMVATGLMQLLDSGTIASLDDPVNKYLKRIQLPSFAGEEITFRHLTTHRAGFEDSFFNAGTEEFVATPVDSETLRRLVPRIVRKPGTLAVYSNVSAALQGVVIEDVTGLALRDYLARNVFTPLGMSRTVLNDNPPAPPGHARPYILYEDGSSRPVEVVAKHPFYAPSGGVYSTAEDMARFVIAHLDAGRGASHPILSSAAFDTMHTVAARNHSGLAGIGVQFFIDEINGERIINHSCGLPGFSSYLAFMPASNVGLFVSVVSARAPKEPFGGLLRCFDGPVEAIAPNFAARFFYEFIKEFVGFGELPDEHAAGTDLSGYVGSYRPERRTHSNVLAALDLLAPDESVIVIGRSEDSGGGLIISQRGPFRSYGDGVLQRDMHPARIYAFDFDQNGRARRMMWSSAQAAARIGFWENPVIARELLGILVGISLSGFFGLFWPSSTHRAARWGRYLPLLVMSCLIVTWSVANLGFAAGDTVENYVNVGGMGRLIVIIVACNLVALAAVAMTVVAIRSWMNSYWGEGSRGLLRRAHFSLITIATLLCIPVFAAFNLLGLHLP